MNLRGSQRIGRDGVIRGKRHAAPGTSQTSGSFKHWLKKHPRGKHSGIQLRPVGQAG